MRRLLLLLLSSLFLWQIGFAQQWLDLIPADKQQNGTYNFYDVQNAFGEYWKDRSIGKSKGWKQFKRWENFMEPRVYPSGVFPKNALWNARLELKNAKKPKSNASWTHLGPEHVPGDISDGSPVGVGRLNCVGFHPTNQDIMYVGSPSGGLWKTTDGGISWITTTDELMSLGVSDIVINPSNTDILYIATGDGDATDTYSIGILKSTDGGNTWQTTSFTYITSQNVSVRKLLMHPNNFEIIYAVSSEGIFRTENAGVDWVLVKPGSFKDIEFMPANPSILYAASDGGSPKIFKSLDNGFTFNPLSLGLPGSGVNRIELAVTPADPQVIYALMSKSSNSGMQGVYKSSNAGDNWVKVTSSSTINLLGWEPDGSDQGGQGWYDLSLAVSPTNAEMVFVGGVNIWRTSNSGTNWTLVGHWTGAGGADYVHADIHMLKYSPWNKLFGCTDGGIYNTTNNGEEWSDLSDGLKILQSYRMSSSATDEDIIMVGNQDNGSYMRVNNEWVSVLGGDGMECLVDHTNPKIVYGEFYFGNIFKSTNGGYNFSYVSPADNGAWVTPYVMHPTDHNTLYAGYSVLYKTTDGGNTWNTISESFGGNLNAIAIAPSNDNYIYAATYSLIRCTKDGGTTWQDVSTGLPSQAITYVTVSNTDPSKVWITLSGYSAGEKVYYSSDAGDTWTNISEGLPAIPANCIVYENNSNDALYVGTDLGVFYRNATMTEWQDFSVGLPNVVVTELEIFYPSHKIRAASFGRGVWESLLYFDETTPIDANFICSDSIICVGSDVVFTDATYGVANEYLWDFGEGAVPQTATTTGPHNVNYSNTGYKTVTLTVTGTSGTDVITKENIINTVNSLTINTMPTAAEICLGSSVKLNASGASNYTWSPETGLNTTDGAVVMASPSITTTYIVVGTQGTCSGQNQITVVVSKSENDSLHNAISLPMGLSGLYSNKCASTQTNEPMPPIGDCNGQMSWCEEGGLQNSVWFYFFAPASGALRIETLGFDNQIAVYDANTWEDLLSGNFTILGANDDYHASDYSAVIEELSCLIPGRRYWLQMDGSGGGVDGECTIELIEIAKPVPSASFSYTVSYLNVQFNDASQNALEYTWDFGDGISSTSASPSHTYAQTGTYEVNLIIVNECRKDSVTQTVTVTENFAPYANAGINQSVDEYSMVTLDGSASNDANVGTTLSYEWTAPSTIQLSSNTVVNPQFTAPGVENSMQLVFTLKVSDNELTSETDSVMITVVNSVGVNALENNNEIRVTPNPNNGNFSLRLPKSLSNGKIYIKIYNSMGDKLLQWNCHCNEQTEKINLSHLSSGIYHIVLENDTEIYRTKFVLQK